MGLLFDINENVLSKSLLVNKSSILKWYEYSHKDLVPFKELKPKKYTKIGNSYYRTDKYNYKGELKQFADIDTYIGVDPISVIGFEHDENLFFVLEMYGNGFKKIGPAVAPKMIYKFIPINNITKKHEGYYINKVKYNLDLECNQKAAKFLKDQFKEMNK